MKPPFYGYGRFLLLWCVLLVWDVSWIAYESARHGWWNVAIFAALGVWAVCGIAANTYLIGKRAAERSPEWRSRPR
jgi:hypothetical protein